jgi:hypothetical protein
MSVLLCVAVSAERLKQADSGAQPPTRWTRDARATWPDGVQDAMSLFTSYLDFSDTVPLDLLTTGDFLSQHRKVSLHRFTHEFLRECAFLAGNQSHPISVFHSDLLLKVKQV